MSMIRFTVEETNLMSIYRTDTGTRRELVGEITAALPYMESDMRELAGRTIQKMNGMTDNEYSQLVIDPAGEV